LAEEKSLGPAQVEEKRKKLRIERLANTEEDTWKVRVREDRRAKNLRRQQEAESAQDAKDSERRAVGRGSKSAPVPVAKGPKPDVAPVGEEFGGRIVLTDTPDLSNPVRELKATRGPSVSRATAAADAAKTE
jgi:hypothetical protein